jgi:DNA-binding NtrC family response regulator
MTKILVVDDHPTLRRQLKWEARGEDREILEAESAEQALQLIQKHDFAVVVTDLRLEDERSGLDVLRAAKEKDIYTQVILVTAYGSPEISVETMRLGAFDYLERISPSTAMPQMIRSKINLALEFREAKLVKESQNGSTAAT